MANKKQGTQIIAGSLILLGGLYMYKSGYFTTSGKKSKVRSRVTDAQKKAFINKIEPSAKVIGTKKGVPPDFITAQLALESNYGASELTSKFNNFGGIKAVGNQPSVSMLTTECKNNICRKVYRDFAIYPTVMAGLEAQSKIYSNQYFKQHQFKTKDPLTYAKLLQSGKIKYATALNYPKAIETTLNEIKRLKSA